MAYEWVNAFLKALSTAPNVTAACRAAGVTRTMAYRHRAADAEFSESWDDALEQSTDDLVGEAYRRARHGTRRPVFYLGEECGQVLEFSDTLTIFLLKSHRPETYRESFKPVEKAGDDDDFIIDLSAED